MRAPSLRQGPARLAKAVAIATIAFGDALAWFADQERWVRMPQEMSHYPSNLGGDLHAAIENVLHLAGNPESIELAALDR